MAGFTLVELLIAMAVGLVVLGAVYSLFTIQNKQLSSQDLVAEMQQNARMAMEIISREIRMAGYNPSNTLTRCQYTGLPVVAMPGSCAGVGITSAAANTISFTADLNGNGALTAGSANPNENIVYDRYESPSGSGIFALGRTSNGTKAPVVERLDDLSFTYFNATGAATTDLSKVREVQISLRTIASRRDPSYPLNGGFRTYTLTSRVAPRNVAY